MAVAAWPATLSQVLDADNFSYEFGPTVIRTEQQNGAAKLRRRFTKGINPVVGTIVLTQSLFATLKTFYETTINGGVDQFSMTHPITGVTANFRFVSQPRLVHKGGINLTLSLNLEEMPS